MDKVNELMGPMVKQVHDRMVASGLTVTVEPDGGWDKKVTVTDAQGVQGIGHSTIIHNAYLLAHEDYRKKNEK